MALERGSSIGSFKVLFRLGSGGMGEVWRGRDERRGLDVAIKVLSPDAVADPDRMRRFAMEAKAASSLKHPNILTIYEVGESEAGPYLVTEYVDGDTVRGLLNDGALPLEKAVDVALQAAEGVASAHAAGMVHRDLKPENLMVNREGRVKILDFGLAKLLRPGEDALNAARTATGMIIGTAGYLSPEQLRGGKASERSDVFALGLVLYEMLTGDNPFRRNNAVDTFTAIMRDDPPPLPEKLGPASSHVVPVLARALAKKPEERYPSARELASDLREAHARIAPPPAAAESVSGDPGRARSPWGVLVAGGLLALAAATFLLLRGC
ncbi:MAG TPA: serine/threonine-protein kinase [Thermoanaerobaculia bacterium]|nr:serine/threonine-protein kinase [Thermoanaerobaculia bacterium]